MGPIVKKIAILGFGTVGQGVYEGIKTNEKRLEQLIGEPIQICAVLVKDITKDRTIEREVLVTNNIEEILKIPDLQIVFEAIVGTEPCFTYLKRFIEKGCHVITANKVMLAHHGIELVNLAQEKGVTVRYEATVAGGVPIISTLCSILKTNHILKLEGILNGTSNFILTEMRKHGCTFEEALKLAKQLGYAEQDPTNDVDGYDAYYKLIILYRCIFGREPNWKVIEREGISTITQQYVELAQVFGLRFRHVAHISLDAKDCWVKPVLVDETHPFYSIDGVDNTIHIQGTLVGGLTFTGAGAGRYPTASAMIEDFVQIFQQKNHLFPHVLPFIDERKHESEIRNSDWAIFTDQETASMIKSESPIIQERKNGKIVFLQLEGTHEWMNQLKQKYSVHVYEILNVNKVANIKENVS